MTHKTTILVVDDEEQMSRAMETVIARMGYAVLTASNGKEALGILGDQSVNMVISDMRMPVMGGEELLAQMKSLFPSIPVVMVTAYGTIAQAVTAMRDGAFDFITKPFSAEDLEKIVSKALSPSVAKVKNSPTKNSSLETRSIITRDPGFMRTIEIATTIARSSASVLIQGESGTGKELIARLIHSSSPRAGGPFVAVNCAALPANLLESELFGHERGAFTGAIQSKEGKFELANKGTILLDEISEMDPLLQAKLLRVLQEREVDRVGGTKATPIDVRVLATTNRDIQESVNRMEFREDLFYRLNVIPLRLPALRERKGDVKLLIAHFLRKYAGQTKKTIGEETLAMLEAYNWPGNVRELENTCERAILLSRGENIDYDDFLIQDGKVKDEVVDNYLTLHPGLTVAEAEKRLIFETLNATDQNKTKAADLLGISIRTLRNKLHEYEPLCR